MNTVKTNTLNGQFPKGTLILGIGGGGANFLDYVQKNSPQPIRFATLGGNTGTGVALIVVERALDLEIPVKVAVTIPFSFEGKERRKQALVAADFLKKKVADTLVFDMDSLKEEVGNYGVDEGFAEINKRIWEHLLESLTTNH